MILEVPGQPDMTISSQALDECFQGGSLVTLADDDDFDCDRSGDHVVTTADSLIALHDAVNTCRRAEHCDADGDGDETASDALALLRFAVDLPATLECSCEYIDQCFGHDEDCDESGHPEYRVTRARGGT